MPLTQLASQLRPDCVKNIQFFGGRLTEVGRERARGKSDIGKWIVFSAVDERGKLGSSSGKQKSSQPSHPLRIAIANDSPVDVLRTAVISPGKNAQIEAG